MEPDTDVQMPQNPPLCDCNSKFFFSDARPSGKAGTLFSDTMLHGYLGIPTEMYIISHMTVCTIFFLNLQSCAEQLS